MLFLANITGWIWSHKKQVAIGVFLLLFVIFAVVAFRSCGKSVKFDHDTVDRINNKNAEAAKVEVREMVKENQDVIKTVDGRTTLSELNEEEKAKEIEKITAQAAAKVEAAKQIKGDVTGPELECILLPEKCQ